MKYRRCTQRGSSDLSPGKASAADDGCQQVQRRKPAAVVAIEALLRSDFGAEVVDSPGLDGTPGRLTQQQRHH